MSGRRSGRTLIQLLYFVARAWLALTTPCVAQTADSHAGAGTSVSHDVTTIPGGILTSQKIFQAMSIRQMTARLRDGVARRDTLM